MALLESVKKIIERTTEKEFEEKIKEYNKSFELEKKNLRVIEAVEEEYLTISDVLSRVEKRRESKAEFPVIIHVTENYFDIYSPTFSPESVPQKAINETVESVLESNDEKTRILHENIEEIIRVKVKTKADPCEIINEIRKKLKTHPLFPAVGLTPQITLFSE